MIPRRAFQFIIPTLFSLRPTNSYLLHSHISPISIQNLFITSRSTTTLYGRHKKKSEDWMEEWNGMKIEDNFIQNVKKTTTRNNKLTTKPLHKYIPKTLQQVAYLKSLQNNTIPIVIGTGPAGCGKTLFACLFAIQQLQSGDIDKIIITRPIISVENEQHGFLPGDIVNKMDPWTRPIFDIFLEFYNKKEVDDMVRVGTIEISPLAYMRGRTFKDSFIIADEMQNASPSQMIMLTTRIGTDTKMVITGDVDQSDRCEDNGLQYIIDKINTYKHPLDISLIQMNGHDIQRSPIVKQLVSLFSKSNDNTISSPCPRVYHY